MQNKFFELIFRADLLYIGERIKKGTFKPSISPFTSKYKSEDRVDGILPLPYSTITGAIKSILGDKKDIHAIGKIIKYKKGYMAVAPYDTALNTAKLPITIEYLADVEGKIYIKKTSDFSSAGLLENEFYLGGLKSKGFGRCKIIAGKEIEPKIIEKGVFLSRIYYEDNILRQFGINKENIIKPYFGYLFKKTSSFDGYYQKSIFENTIINNGYNFLLDGGDKVTVMKTTDEIIKSVLENLSRQIDECKLRADWKGDYFSSNQLDDIRRVFEKNGFEAAKVFVSGKMKPKGNPQELKKNEIIIGLLKQLNTTKGLDVSTKSYIIGKFNQILTVYRKGGNKSEKYR